MSDIPLRDVLPDAFLDAEGDLRRLANVLDGHLAAYGRSAWHWYPGWSQPPNSLDERTYLLLVDTTITLYQTRDDWLELTLDIAWREPATLTVNAAVEVACWCQNDHNMHQVRYSQWPVFDNRELVAAFAEGVAMLADVLASGPWEPRPWRLQAGLPDGPDTNR